MQGRRMKAEMKAGRNFPWRTLYLLLLGQLVSLLLALTTFFASLIAALGVDTPITQGSFSYLAAALIYGSILIFRRHKLLVSWHWYLLLSFIDVHGVFLFNKAYQFTSITSVTMLDCFSLLWVIILTRVFMGTRYSISQFLGAAVCVTGLALVILSDVGVGGDEGGSKPILGDALVIAGTVFYALSNVGEEFCAKRDRIELMAMIGIFGFLISILEISVVELKNVQSIKWSTNLVLAFAGYGLCEFLLFSTFSWFIQMTGATMYNLSILTSDMWVVLIRLFFYHQQVDWLYYMAFGVVAIGLIVYSTGEEEDPGDEIAGAIVDRDDSSRQQQDSYQLLSDGNGEADSWTMRISTTQPEGQKNTTLTL